MVEFTTGLAVRMRKPVLAQSDDDRTLTSSRFFDKVHLRGDPNSAPCRSCEKR